MKIDLKIYPILLLFAFFMLILGSQVTGHWQSTPTEVKVLDPKGEFDPMSIKGYMTFQQVADDTGIPIEYLIKESGLPPDVDANKAFRELGPIYGIDFHAQSVREAAVKWLEENEG